MSDSDQVASVVEALSALKELPPESRIAAYNAIQQALAEMISDISTDPACTPRLIPAEQIQANDYNPNTVASPELDLLEESMLADGITMAIVAMPDVDHYVVIDGFHRHLVASQRLGRRWLPCALLTKPLADRMASTIRHNRARGKHQVELMASLVRGMVCLGWDDARIAKALGMSEEELLRLFQMTGVAHVLAAQEYSRSWGDIA